MGPSDLLGTMEQFSGGHMQRPSPGSCAMILYSPIFVNSDPHQAATTVTHTKRIYRNLLRKETSFVYYTSSVLRKSRHMKQKDMKRLKSSRKQKDMKRLKSSTYETAEKLKAVFVAFDKERRIPAVGASTEDVDIN